MNRASVFVAFVILGSIASGQSLFPGMMYFKFDEPTGSTTTANVASPGVGTANANIVGLTLGGTGQFGGSLQSSGISNNYVDSGWTTSFGTGDWTISVWLDVTGIATANPFGYFLGDSTAGAFRAFTNGAAGGNNVILRGGGVTDTIIAGGANPAQANVVTWVYDSSVPQTRGYLNGSFVIAVAQPALNINGTAPFRVGGYTSTTLPMPGKVDEFRVWSRALTAAEITQMWNQELFDRNVLSVNQNQPGDLFLSLTNISPTGVEGWTLVSAATFLPQGQAPFFGIMWDANVFTILTTPYFAGNPFRWRATDPPNIWPNVPFSVPPGTLSVLSGTTLDFVCVLTSGTFSFDSQSNVERVLMQ
ncbi:MAG: hypothetical protein CMJ83_09850 [Planctomycetes bacterium]|nr:hypothetical protein [Planctomycetota bacterium]